MALSDSIGFLKAVTDRIRLYIDDPGDSAKFTDAIILDMITKAWADVTSDVNRVCGNKIRCRVNISVTDEQRDYVLPGNFGQFLSMEKIEGTHERVQWEVKSNHPMYRYGAGFTIEGPLLRFDPMPRKDETLRVTYVPRAGIPLFEATTAAGEWDTNGLYIDHTMSSTLVAGSLSTLQNAYTGFVLRVLSTTDEDKNAIQERVISAHTNNISNEYRSARFTFSPALSPIPIDGGTDTITYEVVPKHMYRYQDLIAVRVGRLIATAITDADKVALLHREYQEALRTVRLDALNTDGRSGNRFHRQTNRGRRRLGKVR